MHEIIRDLHDYLLSYGYVALALCLLAENAGLPLPGETILIVASVLAYDHEELRLPWIILTAILAATVGDNIGYWIGVKGGRPLLERLKNWLHIKPESIAQGERLFAKYGSFTIFFARFIAGMRIVAGPLAGVLRMEWKSFALWNFLGACVWVTTISTLGYLFASQLERLVKLMKVADLILLIIGIAAVVHVWKRFKRGKTPA